MHPNTKGLREPDFTPHPAEKEILGSLGESHGIGVEGKEIIKELRLAGVPWSSIFGWLVQFGPVFVGAIQAILAALKQPPPGFIAMAAEPEKKPCTPEEPPFQPETSGGPPPAFEGLKPREPDAIKPPLPAVAHY